jgi:hypothetical protein
MCGLQRASNLLLLYTKFPSKFEAICCSLFFDCRRIEVCIARTGNGARMGPKQTRSSEPRHPKRPLTPKVFSKSWDILFANEVFSAILDYSVSLFRNILYILCCHRQINMTKESLDCKWISRSCSHCGSRSAKGIEARSLRSLDSDFLRQP